MTRPSPDGPLALLPSTHSPEIAARFAYSYGVAHGDVVWISGQVALRDGQVQGVGDVAAQTQLVFDNLEAIVREAGGDLADLVETTTYVTDRAHLAAVNEVRASRLTGPVPPTSTLLVVAGLARPEFLVEISATAVIRGEKEKA